MEAELVIVGTEYHVQSSMVILVRRLAQTTTIAIARTIATIPMIARFARQRVSVPTNKQAIGMGRLGVVTLALRALRRASLA